MFASTKEACGVVDVGVVDDILKIRNEGEGEYYNRVTTTVLCQTTELSLGG